MPSRGTPQAVLAELFKQCNDTRITQLEGYVADVMPPLSEWPERYSRMFLAPRIGHVDRLALVRFFAVNGAPPILLDKWARAQAGWLWHKGSALDMANIIDMWRDDRLKTNSAKEERCSYCCWTQQLELPQAPHFAKESVGRAALGHKAGQTHWDDASRALRQLAATLQKDM